MDKNVKEAIKAARLEYTLSPEDNEWCKVIADYAERAYEEGFQQGYAFCKYGE